MKNIVAKDRDTESDIFRIIIELRMLIFAFVIFVPVVIPSRSLCTYFSNFTKEPLNRYKQTANIFQSNSSDIFTSSSPFTTRALCVAFFLHSQLKNKYRPWPHTNITLGNKQKQQ